MFIVHRAPTRLTTAFYRSMVLIVSSAEGCRHELSSIHQVSGEIVLEADVVAAQIAEDISAMINNSWTRVSVKPYRIYSFPSPPTH